jgi:hypothetical protein
VADGVHLPGFGNRGAQRGSVQAATLLLDLVLVEEPVAAVEQAQLEAAGACVDDQDAGGFQG